MIKKKPEQGENVFVSCEEQEYKVERFALINNVPVGAFFISFQQLPPVNMAEYNIIRKDSHSRWERTEKRWIVRPIKND